MAIVDSDGRLWGRVNLVDAVLGLLLVGLLPLGYGAYMLFRVPPAVLTGIEPSTLTEGPNLRVTIRGANLRPFLRVSFDTVQGLNFLFADSTHAEVELNPMTPGVYDVVLYDQKQERARLLKALTILAPPKPLPTTRVIVVGKLISLKPGQASQVRAGMTLPDDVEVLGAGRAAPAVPKVYANGPIIEVPAANLLQMPVRLRMSCDVLAPGGYPECFAAAGFPLRPTFVGGIKTESGVVAFQVDQVSGDQNFENLTVAVRFITSPVVLAEVRRGDVDVAITENEFAAGARVASLAPVKRQSDEVAEQVVTFQVRSQRGTAGWSYTAVPLRLGSQFMFRTSRYELSGVVVSIAGGSQPAASGAR
ncbi:MAG: IPT/TIG domain-containing protein [Acidobacteriota bacterium]|nr:IPT/TIG domain-containing protein [Acidobacteriota bacterium]